MCSGPLTVYSCSTCIWNVWSRSHQSVASTVQQTMMHNRNLGVPLTKATGRLDNRAFEEQVSVSWKENLKKWPQPSCPMTNHCIPWSDHQKVFPSPITRKRVARTTDTAVVQPVAVLAISWGGEGGIMAQTLRMTSIPNVEADGTASSPRFFATDAIACWESR